jgi:hypothetical protein
VTDHGDNGKMYQEAGVNTEKFCKKCGQNKPVEEFYKNRTASDGLSAWCKACTLGRMKELRVQSGKNTADQQEAQETPAHVAAPGTGEDKTTSNDRGLMNNREDIMKNKLIDLNNHLFAQIERLSNEDLTGDKLQEEINRSKAVCNVSNHIVENAGLALRAHTAINNGLVKSAPAMIGIEVSSDE